MQSSHGHRHLMCRLHYWRSVSRLNSNRKRQLTVFYLCAPFPRGILCTRGEKGAHKQKSERYRLRFEFRRLTERQ